MALHTWTTRTAQAFIGNVKIRDPAVRGLEVWSLLIKEFDPVNVRVASKLMKGETSRTWSGFHAKHIDFEKRMLEYERRVPSHLLVSDPEKC